jgi:hypothetical protein
METGSTQRLATQLPTSQPRRVNTRLANESSAQKSEDPQKQKAAEAEMRQQEAAMLQELRARDREVRAHEAAHLAAGRPYIVSGPTYTYQQGPDGRSYAIGGEVQLDTSEEQAPKDTLDKAETVRRAALAPAEPSPQDLRVASVASDMAARARLDIALERRQQQQAELDNQQQEQTVSTRSSRVSIFDSSPADQAAESVNVNVFA